LRDDCHRGDLEVPRLQALDVVPKYDLIETRCDLICDVLLEK
jgi:hypothetical protein